MTNDKDANDAARLVAGTFLRGKAKPKRVCPVCGGALLKAFGYRHLRCEDSQSTGGQT